MITKQELNDPNSTYNQTVLAQLRKKYPTMTADELVADRTRALATLREALGKDAPSDDVEFLAMLKRAGVGLR